MVFEIFPFVENDKFTFEYCYRIVVLQNHIIHTSVKPKLIFVFQITLLSKHQIILLCLDVRNTRLK